MELDFLSAQVPLVKTISRKADDSIQTSPYPLVTQLTNHRVDVEDINEMYDYVALHSDLKHTLLKGLLSKNIEHESRKGLTNQNDHTAWICLDFDFYDGWESIDDLLLDIDPALPDTDHIWTHSSSAGIQGPAGLRGHAFFILEGYHSPAIIKLWLKERNLECTKLREHITLTASAMALRWPLDISTCQNDKLIYISAPELNNIEDPITDRIELRIRNQRHFEFPGVVLPQAIQETEQNLVDDLRRQGGMNRRKIKTKFHNGVELMTNPNRTYVSGQKDCGDKIRLNLAGGDSWGYYVWKKEPEIVHNFKGEPRSFTKDLIPDFYAELMALRRPSENKPVVFRRAETDQYYNGMWKPDEEDLTLYSTSSKDRLRDFLAQYGEDMPPFVEDWGMTFEPHNTELINFDRRWCNLFQPTPFMKMKDHAPNTIPRTIYKVLYHLCGSDKVFLDYFINWFACIFKHRAKLMTSIMFQGTFGTGKGLAFRTIMMPLLGERHTNMVTTTTFDDMFNAYLETCLLLFVDEANMDDTTNTVRTMNKLKNYITEKQVMIRAMRRNPTLKPSFVNLIFASNQELMLRLEAADRRFNIAPRQENKLEITDAEIDMISEELEMFAAYLNAYPASLGRARKVLENEARSKLISASKNSLDNFFTAIDDGDIDYFEQYLSDAPSAKLNPAYIEYKSIVENWIDDYDRGQKSIITRDQLQAIYCYLQNQKTSPTKFSRLCKINQLEIKPIWSNGKTRRGISVQWNTKIINIEDSAKNE